MFNKLYSDSAESFYKLIKDNLDKNKKMFIVTANPETFMISEEDNEMKKLILDNETTIVPDGIGIVRAAKKISTM